MSARRRTLPGSQRHVRVRRPGRPLNQRKNRITAAAGMNGPHQELSPNASSVDEPPLTNSMIAPAHANALTRFSPVNFIAFVPAYAQAIGMAVRNPGRNLLTRTRAVSLAWTRR